MPDSRPHNIIDLVSPEQQIRSAIERKSADPATASEPSVSIGRCRIARRTQMMLAIRLCSGEVEVLPYATLARIRSEDTDRLLKLSFCGGDISIEGEHLTRLFHYLCEHRVMEICQSDRAECMSSEGEICVHSVKMQLRD